MTKALVDMMENESPFIIKGIPSSLMRMFLPPDVADFLEIPEHKFEELIIKLAVHFAADVEHIADESSRRRKLIRKFNLHLIGWMINVDRGGKRAQFEIPDHLRRRWDYGKKEEAMTFWQRLWRWLKSLISRH
jgi:hypothetical protein